MKLKGRSWKEAGTRSHSYRQLEEGAAGLLAGPANREVQREVELNLNTQTLATGENPTTSLAMAGKCPPD